MKCNSIVGWSLVDLKSISLTCSCSVTFPASLCPWVRMPLCSCGCWAGSLPVLWSMSFTTLTFRRLRRVMAAFPEEKSIASLFSFIALIHKIIFCFGGLYIWTYKFNLNLKFPNLSHFGKLAWNSAVYLQILWQLQFCMTQTWRESRNPASRGGRP